MAEMSLNVKDLNDMCRLCLSTGVTLLDIFQFSTEMEYRVADVIMKCAPVQITKCDRMPNVICRLCYTKLKKNHQFQMQIIESEKTLRHYFQQLNASDKQIKTECSGGFSIHDPNADITVKSLISTGCADDTVKTFCNDDKRKNFVDSKLIEDINVNWKEKEPGNVFSENKVKEESTSSFEIKDEPIDDNLQISTECTDETLEFLSKGYDSEITCEDTKIDIDNTWGNFEGQRSADVIEDFDYRAEAYINPSVNIEINKKATKIVYKCDFCNKCFAHPSNLCKHKRVHTGDKPYQCDVCNRHFSQSQHLKNHKLTHTGEKRYQCDVCNKCFNRSVNLNRHKRVHTGEKPYRCSICDKSFNAIRNLNTHLRTHTGEKPYQCFVCNKQFSQSQHLKTHERTHTGEKPYQCDVCNKCFSQSVSLISHKRTHTGEKPYQCFVCNKLFSQSQHLKIHERTHTGEKPYQCDVCNKCFSQSVSLISHKRTHTGEKTYRCDVCKKRFSHSQHLKSHKHSHTCDKS